MLLYNWLLHFGSACAVFGPGGASPNFFRDKGARAVRTMLKKVPFLDQDVFPQRKATLKG